MHKLLGLFIVMFLLFGNVACAFDAYVTKVIDGDTIMVNFEDQKDVEFRIRLYGVDTPELNQPYGREVKLFLKDLVLHKNVQLDKQGVDNFGRYVCIVTYDDMNINELLVANGNAWVYRKFCKETFCADWLNLQATATIKHKGLWSQPDPIEPWDWRSGNYKHNSKCNSTKRYCKDMISCEEAKFYFTTCNLPYLDGNKNGVPCEKLCK